MPSGITRGHVGLRAAQPRSKLRVDVKAIKRVCADAVEDARMRTAACVPVAYCIHARSM